MTGARTRWGVGHEVALATSLAGLAWLAFALQVAPYQLDDAFITYRYAANLLAGSGLTFEPAALPAEGFSSPLWLLLLTAAGAVTGAGAIPWVAFALGGTAVVASLAILAQMGRAPASPGEPPGGLADLPRRVAPPLLACLLLAVSAPITFHGNTGLETGLFLAAILAVAGAMSGSLPLSLGLAAAAFAPWIRPEGLWLPVVLAAQLCAQRDRAALRRAILLTLAVAGSAALLFALRGVLFQQLLPNTYAAKPPDRLEGLRYVVENFVSVRGALLLVLAILGVFGGARRHRGWLAAAAAWAVAAVVEGGDWMPAGRFLIPCFALLAAAASGAMSIGRATRPLVVLTLVVIAIAAGAGDAADHADLADITRRTLGEEDRQIRRWLVEAGVDGVALVDIGEIGFHGGLEIVDLGGLTDPVIGRAPGGRLAKAFDRDYLFSERAPAAIVLRVDARPELDVACRGAVTAEDLRSDVERHVFADPALARDYRLARAVIPAYERSPVYGRLIYLRRDLGPAPPAWAGECVTSVEPRRP